MMACSTYSRFGTIHVLPSVPECSVGTLLLVKLKQKHRNLHGSQTIYLKYLLAIKTYVWICTSILVLGLTATLKSDVSSSSAR